MIVSGVEIDTTQHWTFVILDYCQTKRLNVGLPTVNAVHIVHLFKVKGIQMCLKLQWRGSFERKLSFWHLWLRFKHWTTRRNKCKWICIFPNKRSAIWLVEFSRQTARWPFPGSCARQLNAVDLKWRRANGFHIGQDFRRGNNIEGLSWSPSNR